MTTQDGAPTRSESYAFGASPAAQQVFARRTAGADIGFLLPYLRTGMQVADLGCGAGTISLGLAEAVAPGQVQSIDLSEPAIDKAKALAAERGIANVTFTVGSVYEPHLPEAAFDAVLFSGVLAHLSNPEQALQQAHRLLKSGGVIAAREMQKSGDWFSGPSCGAAAECNGFTIQAIRAVGGDPFLGGRLKALLREAGFVRAEAGVSYSPALSAARPLGDLMVRILSDTRFADGVILRGDASQERLKEIAAKIQVWLESEDSVAAIAECTALAWKPESDAHRM